MMKHANDTAFINIFFSCMAEETLGPYAWRGIRPHAPDDADDSAPSSLAICSKELAEKTVWPRGPKWKECLQPNLLAKPSVCAMICQATSEVSIAFRLPKCNATAGAVLRHAACYIEGLFERMGPLIWKVGYTHNPCWRWENETYGYKFSKDQWTNMIVPYISFEPYGPAMLEAALIEKYSSVFVAKIWQNWA